MNDLIIKSMPYADKLAARKKRFVGRSVSYDDLQAAAYYGLCDAANNYKKEKNTEFQVYAKKRIIGEIEEQCQLLSSHGQILPDNIEEICRTFNDIDAADLVDKLLKPLSCTGRRLIEMHYLENFDNETISKVLGCGIDSVPVLLSYYRRILREKWQGKLFQLTGNDGNYI